MTLCGAAEIFRGKKTPYGASAFVTWVFFFIAALLIELFFLSLLSDGQQIWEMEASVDKDKSQPVRIWSLPGTRVQFA